MTPLTIRGHELRVGDVLRSCWWVPGQGPDTVVELRPMVIPAHLELPPARVAVFVLCPGGMTVFDTDWLDVLRPPGHAAMTHDAPTETPSRSSSRPPR